MSTQLTLKAHGFGLMAKKLVAHLRLDSALPVGIAAGGSKQETYGTRREALIVAAFRPWRGSRRAVA